MSGMFTDANFEEEVLKSEIPVLVDFYADWCGPCKMMAPIIDELAKEYDGKWKIGKCNKHLPTCVCVCACVFVSVFFFVLRVELGASKYAKVSPQSPTRFSTRKNPILQSII